MKKAQKSIIEIKNWSTFFSNNVQIGKHRNGAVTIKGGKIERFDAMRNYVMTYFSQ